MADSVTELLAAGNALWRHFLRHPAQGLFILTGISLGVALLIGVIAINDVARHSYRTTEDALRNPIRFKLEPRSPQSHLPLAHYRTLRRAGLDQSLPVLQGRLLLADGSHLRLTGIDPLALRPATPAPVARTPRNWPAQFDLLAFIRPPYQLLMNSQYAQAAGLHTGDSLHLANGTSLGPIRLIAPQYSSGAAAVVDITYAQQLLQRSQQLSYIAFADLTPAQHRWLVQWLNTHPTLQLRALDNGHEASQLSESFHLNLAALGLLAFIVGLFIAYNALQFSVLQRQLLVCRLRAAGLSLRSVMLALLLECLVWIILATLIGTLLGVWLARFLLPDVAATLESLFRAEISVSVTFQGTWLWQALLLSTCSGLIALGLPLLHLARTPILLVQQRQHQSITGGRQIQRQAVAALALLSGAALLRLLPGTQSISLLQVACLMLASALLLPWLLQQLLYTLHRQINGQRYPLLHWLVADGRSLLTRSHIALMAFLLALSASIGILTMVGSFRIALTDYLQQRLNADLYLSLPAEQASAITAWLSTRPEIAYLGQYRYQRTSLNDYPGTVIALADHPLERASVTLHSSIDNLWPALFAGDAVLISESLAQKTATVIGDRLRFTLGDAPLSLPVAGIFYDYGNPAGQAFIADRLLRQHNPAPPSGLRLYLQPSADLAHLQQQLVATFTLAEDRLVPQRTVLQRAIALFEQTFQITAALNSLTLAVAAIGIFCALAAITFAHQQQMATLKSLGLSQRQLLGCLLGQQLLLAGLTALLAIPAGLALAWLLIKQVNVYAFGWTMPMQLFASHYLWMWLVGVSAIICSSLLPLWRLSRISVLVAFREAP